MLSSLFCLLFLEAVIGQNMPDLPVVIDQNMPELPDKENKAETPVPEVCDDSCQFEQMLRGADNDGPMDYSLDDGPMDYSLDFIEDPQSRQYTHAIPMESKEYHLPQFSSAGFDIFKSMMNLDGYGFVSAITGFFSTVINSKDVSHGNLQKPTDVYLKSTSAPTENTTWGHVNEPFDNTQIGEYSSYIASHIQNIKCLKEDCSPFSKEWHDGKDEVCDIFTNLSSVPGYSDIKNDFSNFKTVVLNIMKIVKPKYNMDLVQRGILYSLDMRSDCENIQVDTMKIFPELSATCNIGYEGNEEGPQDYAGETWGDLHNFRFSRVSREERALNYFREDDDLHTFHAEWHSSNENRASRNRRKERFWYMHRHLINRYIVERRVAGMPNLERLNSRSGSFSSVYDTRVGNHRSFRRYQRSKDRCELSRTDKRDLAGRLRRVNQNRRGSLEDFSRRLESTYHNSGHMKVAAECKSDRRNRNHHIMASAPVSGRDPVFYRWHFEIEQVFKEFLNIQRPYRKQDLLPPTGVSVQDVSLSSCGRNNIVNTFWERYEGNKYRLNHKSYMINIRLSNAARRQGKVVVRLFIFLESFLGSNLFPIELDKFVYTMKGDTTETIIRRDNTNSFAQKGNDRCGWPSNLQLPKGTLAGERFRLVAFVNMPTSRVVNVGESNRYSQVLCGGHNRDGGFEEDGKTLGFPFEKRWWSDDARRNVLNNGDSEFGSISKGITITHTGVGTRGC